MMIPDRANPTILGAARGGCDRSSVHPAQRAQCALCPVPVRAPGADGQNVGDAGDGAGIAIADTSMGRNAWQTS